MNSLKRLILAGGCFWGVEAYFDQLKGVTETSVGYVDGNMEHPTYELVCEGIATHAEAVEVVFNENILTTQNILEHYFRFVDPFSINKQGNDRGPQYRTGIYVDNQEDIQIIKAYFNDYFGNNVDKVQVKIKENKDYVKAESYHQKYLNKNPRGYCHIDLNLVKEDEKKDA